MTTTAIINSQSIGTSTNVGDFVQPTRTALQATTTQVQVIISITRGAAIPEGSYVGVYQAVSPVNWGTGAPNMQQVQMNAQFTRVPLRADRVVIEIASGTLPTAAGFHYCWLQVPVMSVASTITVNLEETP